MKITDIPKLGVEVTKETPRNQKIIAIRKYKQSNQLGLVYLSHIEVLKDFGIKQTYCIEEYTPILSYDILNIIGEYLFIEHLNMDLYQAHSMYYRIHLKYVIPISMYDNDVNFIGA